MAEELQAAVNSADEAMNALAELAAQLAADKAAEWRDQAQPPQPDRRALVAALIEQEDRIRASEPDFDLYALLNESPPFRALILIGEPVEKALRYVRPEQEAQRAEAAVLERIRKRTLRPAGIDSRNRSAEPDPAERLDEDELRRIDALLKRGQKVYLK